MSPPDSPHSSPTHETPLQHLKNARVQFINHWKTLHRPHQTSIAAEEATVRGLENELEVIRGGIDEILLGTVVTSPELYGELRKRECVIGGLIDEVKVRLREKQADYEKSKVSCQARLRDIGCMIEREKDQLRS
ncbi:hypothetical protein RUND412_001415 [Rhizina undulata]